MSTISDAVKKKRGEEDEPSPETRGARIVHVEVPKDHTTRNTLLAVLVVALLLTGLFIGGYTLLNRTGAFAPRAPKEQPAGTVTSTRNEGGQGSVAAGQNGGQPRVEPGDDTAESGNTATETGTPPVPELQGIFPDRVDPIAVLNGKRVRPGGVVDGYTLKAVGDDRVTLERDGKLYELVLE